MKRRATVVSIDGRELELSNLAKPMYASGFTKAHVLDYLRRIAPAMLPHLRDRALTMKRYPDGVDGESFYEKRCPSYAPPWVRVGVLRLSGGEDAIAHCVVDDRATLLWAANLACLEFHVPLARVGAPDVPTSMVFDLDPGPGADVVDCGRVALRLRDALGAVELVSFVKSSGSKGLQVYVPLNTPSSFGATKEFARSLGQVLERETPERVTTRMLKSERQGRVLVDWAQNDPAKTTVCAYSLRARTEPTISAPLAWPEVERLVRTADARVARLLPEDVVARFEADGDVFGAVETLEQSLPALT